MPLKPDACRSKVALRIFALSQNVEPIITLTLVFGIGNLELHEYMNIIHDA